MGIRSDRRKKQELSKEKQQGIFEASFICEGFCKGCQYNKILHFSESKMLSRCQKVARKDIEGNVNYFDQVIWHDKNGTFINELCPSLAMMFLKADVEGLYRR